LHVRDSAVLGAAILGAVGAGIHADVESAAASIVKVDKVFEPSPDAELHHVLYESYRSSYDALAEVHAKLAAWRRRST
jgi:xylulokinase